ncbi:MAG: phosphoribosylanthranilate isomerase [Prolixibacteraceae bacterium]
MIVKVCGLRDPENIAQVTALPGVDLIGLIFYAPSPRFVDSEATADAVSSLTTVKVVGVFVNESTEVVAKKCKQYNLSYIQLHGSEKPEYIAELRSLLPSGVKLIKAFPIKAEEDLATTSGYEGECEYFLFDTPTSGYGGSGITFDWNILQNYQGTTPFLLSGGISPDSIGTLHNFHHRMWAGIDLNSRFETSPGMKDIPLLSDFLQNIQIHHV